MTPKYTIQTAVQLARSGRPTSFFHEDDPSGDYWRVRSFLARGKPFVEVHQQSQVDFVRVVGQVQGVTEVYTYKGGRYVTLVLTCELSPHMVNAIRVPERGWKKERQA